MKENIDSFMNSKWYAKSLSTDKLAYARDAVPEDAIVISSVIRKLATGFSVKIQ